MAFAVDIILVLEKMTGEVFSLLGYLTKVSNDGLTHELGAGNFEGSGYVVEQCMQ
jgi:hypothetical protein